MPGGQTRGGGEEIRRVIIGIIAFNLGGIFSEVSKGILNKLTAIINRKKRRRCESW